MELGIILVWLGMYLGLGAIALPAASFLFCDFADRGAGLAIPLSFGVIALLSYWVGQVRFDLVTGLVAVGGLGLLSTVALRRGVTPDRKRFRDAAIVFTLAYLFLIVIRLLRPGAFPGGGEKFLDFGLLASLLRANVLPPIDMWFAGEPVQYYYGGHMLAAVFAHLTNTSARFAYNTALAGYFAAYITAAWGFAGTLAANLDRFYWVGGAVGAFFVGLAGNLSTPVRLLVWLLPESAGSRLADLFGLDVAGLATGILNFDYWLASRVIHADLAGEWQLITEFPLFAFLNGDLHGHMMSPVFLLLGASLAFAYWKRPEANRRGRLFRLLLIAPVGGLLVITNTWSAPAVFGIAVLALIFAPAPPWTLFPDAVSNHFENAVQNRPLYREFARIAVALVLGIGLAVIAAVTVWPFLTGAASGRSIGFLPTPRSNFGGLLLVYGAFLGISAGYLAARSRRTRWCRMAVLLAFFVAITLLFRATALSLFGPLLVGGWYLLRTRSDVNFETVLLVGSLGLLIIIEFVYVIEQAGPGRMNTVFKISAQIWALWSVAVGAMAAWLIGPNGPALPLAETRVLWRERVHSWFTPRNEDQTSAETATASTRSHRIATVSLLVLVVLLGLYSIGGVGWAVSEFSGEPTLDATAYIDAQHPDEADAIAWLADRSGQPTMVSAPGTKIYRWVNAPSSMTGIPTVAGWAHEIGYRGHEPYQNRVNDVTLIYEIEDPASRRVLLEKYDVTYIYVGPIEQQRYSPPDFGQEPGISVAYTDANVTIYRVQRDD